MALLKAKTTATKVIVLANNDVESYRKFDNKTLADIDQTEALVDIKIGSSTYEGKKISNLVLEYTDKKIAIPFSKELSNNLDMLEDDDILSSCQFNIRRKKGEEDKEGDYANYSGALYISFGRPSGITFEEETSLVATEPENAKN